MNTKLLFSCVILLLGAYTAIAQEDKKPVAENDYVTVRPGQTVEIRVTDNDFAFDDHPFKVLTVIAGNYGTHLKTDSTIIYNTNICLPFRNGQDLLRYSIIDLENNLISDFAKVYIEIVNDGFDMLDVNNVSARINAYGLHFWDGISEVPGYEIPKGSGKTSIFNQSLWVGGLDESGLLYLAAEKYRQMGTDFFAGPTMDSTAYNMEQDIHWHKVWKLSSHEIDYHRLHWQDEAYVPIANILNWPGTGDISLGQPQYLAPYYDWNSDGMYNPLAGDFPLIKGDQAIYVITNDSRNLHTETGGRKMGIEIQTMFYAYNNPEDSALYNTIFTNQRILNRSSKSYHNVYVGRFLDFDLGYYFDDFLHSDTLLNSFICYNADDMDGNGNTGEYGLHPPAQAFTCLNFDMDVSGYFLLYPQPSYMHDPNFADEYYNYLRGLWKDGTRFSYGGSGYGGEVWVSHIFTGNPVTGEGWTETDSPIGPGDRRGLISSGPHTFLPGDTIHHDFALVFARDYQGDNLSAVALLKQRIQQIHDFYQNSLSVPEIPIEQIAINIFPNPFGRSFYVEFKSNAQRRPVDYIILDVLGKQVEKGKIIPGEVSKIHLSRLSPGIFFIRIFDGQNTITRKLIKK